MAQTTARKFTGRKRARKFFGHIREAAAMPNLIEVQKASYDQFILVDEPKGDFYGGSVAAPAFGEIAKFALPYMRVSPN